jgi:hypothetical protein
MEYMQLFEDFKKNNINENGDLDFLDTYWSRMIEAIASNNIKTLYKISRPNEWDGGKRTKESLGKGHFRWNDRAYTLNEKELEYLRKFFDIK